jgi:hypothetical protein
VSAGRSASPICKQTRRVISPGARRNRAARDARPPASPRHLTSARMGPAATAPPASLARGGRSWRA